MAARTRVIMKATGVEEIRSATAAIIHAPGSISITLTLLFHEMSFGDSRIGSAKKDGRVSLVGVFAWRTKSVVPMSTSKSAIMIRQPMEPMMWALSSASSAITAVVAPIAVPRRTGLLINFVVRWAASW